MKISKFKLMLEPAKYGWIYTKINNPLVYKRPIRIEHSGLLPFYDDLIDILQLLKYKKKAKLEIQEEGPETIIEFTNYGNTIKAQFQQRTNMFNRYNYKYQFKNFVCFYNKKQFIKEFKSVVLKHYLKDKEEYNQEHFIFLFDIKQMKKL